LGYCKKCGAELEETAKFCSKCGTPVYMQAVETSEPYRRPRRLISPFAIASIALGIAVVVIALIAIAFFAGLFPFGATVGSGNLKTQAENFNGFTAVDVNSGFRVHITQSSTYNVTITADDNLFNYIEVTQSGDTLIIGTKNVYNLQGTLRADIFMPDLQDLQLSGGSNVNAAGFNMSTNFNADLSGGSSLTMTGQAGDLTAACSGGSSLNLQNFAVHNADITFSGGSHGTINLDGRLDADLSGGSQLFYMGNPTLGDVNTTGGSSITPKQPN
jgi:hypothetical protein